MSTHRSFLEQAAHYFTRPHEGVPAAPVASPAAWRGSEMRGRASEWLASLSGEDLDELDAAVTSVQAAGLPMEAVTRASFPLPGLAPKIAAWRREIESGRGFIVVRGLPVSDWGRDRAALAYWGLGHHLGLPGAQNPAGELLGHVVDYGEEKENPTVRRYRTTGRIDFHCDAADVVGLLCLEPARAGGQSRIASSVVIWNEIARSYPDLAKRLFEPFLLDRRGEERPGEPGFLPIPPAGTPVERFEPSITATTSARWCATRRSGPSIRRPPSSWIATTRSRRIPTCISTCGSSAGTCS